MEHSNPVLMKTIREQTRRLLREADPWCRKYRASLPDPEIRFDLTGQAAGQARWDARLRPVLRYNLAIARRHPEDFVRRTVPHEVAHLVTAACHGRTRPHGPEWQAVMAFFGIEQATRCHSYSIDEAAVRRQRRWTYICACDRHQISTTRHRRIEAGKTTYHCRRCKAPLRPAPPEGD